MLGESIDFGNFVYNINLAVHVLFTNILIFPPLGHSFIGFKQVILIPKFLLVFFFSFFSFFLFFFP